MVVGVSRIEIFFPEAHSLKDKRQMLKKILDKTRAKFNVSMIEIADSNLWQKGRIGFSIVGIKQDHVHAAIENVQEYVESLYVGEVIDCWTEIIVIGNEI